jgi:hypothetical protein
MSVLSAFKDGCRRVWNAPAVLAGLVSLNVLFGVPLSRAFAAAMPGEGTVGRWTEFLLPPVPGQHLVSLYQAVVDLDAADVDTSAIRAALAAIGLTGIFLIGGVLDRLARDRATGSHGFFAACGIFLFRSIRLSLCIAPVYAAIWPWLDTESPERGAVATLVGLAANLLADYALIRMVVEDRRSAIGSLVAAARFIGRHPGATVGLYLLNAAVFMLPLALFYVVEPYLAFGLGLTTTYLVIFVVAALVWMGSQTALFQSRLAHAGYTARRVPAWPDSAAADAIRPG